MILRIIYHRVDIGTTLTALHALQIDKKSQTLFMPKGKRNREHKPYLREV